MDKKDPAHSPHRHKTRSTVLVWAVVVLGILYVGLQSEKTHNETLQLSKDTQNCSHQFNAAITSRSNYSDEMDDFAADERKALTGWLIELLKPPPEIAKLDYQDPVRQQWGIDMTNDYIGNMNNIEDKRKEAQHKRDATPLPPLTCGR